MIDLSKIKLIVWDLDDTFWTGTISEEEVKAIPENIKLVKDLTDCGIINSICSKNDEDVAVKRLKEMDVWEYFVFASINWDNKAMRLKALIDDMALRPVNVLFIDDNSFNLEEAKHVMPEIQTSMPEVIPHIIHQLEKLPKKDLPHKRLKQYKVLEEKRQAAKSYSSNEDFLFSTNIQVEMCEDCSSELNRIHELLMRSNQLNFTKKRIPVDQLESIINDSNYRCGYVKVKDNFGDYGIVGFYAMKDGKLEHFFFSCRTMGQMIEQWVYAQLGFPQLEVVGEVRTQLNDSACPAWINQNLNVKTNSETNLKETHAPRILVKGPCDLSRACMYLQGGQGVDEEMTYVRDAGGQTVFYHNHSAGIMNIIELDDAEKKLLVDKCKYIDPQAFHTKMFSGDYDVVYLSTLMESNHGIYQLRNGKGYVVIGQYDEDITLPIMEHEAIANGFSGYRFEKKELAKFIEDFEYLGCTTAQQYKDFLKIVVGKLPKQTSLCLILGATSKWGRDVGKAKMHEEINNAVKEVAAIEPRVKYIDVDECISDLTDFERDDYIDHYQARVYYRIAEKMSQIASNGRGKSVKLKSTSTLWLDDHLNKVKVYFNRDGRLYKILLKIYMKLTGRQ